MTLKRFHERSGPIFQAPSSTSLLWGATASLVTTLTSTAREVCTRWNLAVIKLSGLPSSSMGKPMLSMLQNKVFPWLVAGSPRLHQRSRKCARNVLTTATGGAPEPTTQAAHAVVAKSTHLARDSRLAATNLKSKSCSICCAQTRPAAPSLGT